MRRSLETVEFTCEQCLPPQLMLLELGNFDLEALLLAKSRVDTIRKMPASLLALIKPCFQTFSCV